MKVLFLHGLESRPGGTKAIHLRGVGHQVLNPFLPKEDFERSVEIAQKEIDEESPDVIVGSSRGGAVAMSVDPKGAKLVLIAPAWKNFGVQPSVGGNAIVLHSPEDEIIPFEDSKQIKGVSAVVPVGVGHRMADDEALAAIEQAVEGNFKGDN